MTEKQTQKTPRRPNHHKTLSRSLRIGVRLLVYPLAAVVIVVLAASILLQTDAARTQIKRYVEKLVESRLGGQLQVGKISGSLLFDISLEDVRLFHAEGPLLTASRVSANYFLPLLLTKVLYIQEIQTDRLSLNLLKTADGRWNVQTLLPPAEEKKPDRRETAPFKVIISRIALRDTSLSLTETRNNQIQTRRVNSLHLVAGLTLGADSFVGARIMELSFITNQPGIAVDSLRGKIDYNPKQKQIKTENLRIRSNGADLTLNGLLGWDSGKPAVEMRTLINTLSVSKIANLMHLPALGEGALRGSLYVRGDQNRIFHELELNLDRASLHTNGYIDEFLTERLRIDISGALRQVRPQRLPLPALTKIAGELNCDFKVTAADLVRPNRKGTISLNLKPSDLYGYQVSQGNLQAVFDQNRFILKESRLSGPPGSVQIHSGLAEVFDSNRSRKFTLSASFKDADLERITKRPDLSGNINLDVEVAAELPPRKPEAAEAAKMSVRIAAKLNPSGITGIGIAGGSLLSTWNGKILGLEKLDVSSDAGRLTLSGNVVPVARSSQIEYHLTLPRLKKTVSLMTRLIPEKNRTAFRQLQLAGDLAVSGELSGHWEQPNLSAKITGTKLTYSDFSAGGVQATAAWKGGTKKFHLDATAKIKDFRFNQTRLSEADLILNLSPEKARVDIHLAQDKKATARIDGEMKDWALPTKTVTINTLQLSLEDWGGIERVFKTVANQRPIHMTISKGALDISSFELISGRTTLSLKGNLSPAGKLKTKMVLKTLDLLQLSRLWHPKDAVTGTLSAESEISGSLARPLIQTSLKIENGSGYDFSFSKIDCALNYRLAQVIFRASGDRNGSKILDINAKAGIDFSLMPFQIEPRPKQFEITAHIDGIKLSALPVPKPAGVHFDGLITLDARAAGNLNAPEIEGKLSFKDGLFSLAGAPSEKLSFQNLDIDFDYRNSRALLDAVLIRENQKALDIKGGTGLQISLVPFRFVPIDKDLKMTLNARDLKLSLLPLPKPAGLELDGTLNLNASASGSIARPVITGSLTIRDGSLSLPGPSLSYEEMTADIGFSPGKFTIATLQLKGDKEGYLRFEGEIETKGLKPSAFNIRLNGENVYIPYKSSVYARIRPNLTFSGVPKAPKLTGTLTVTESRIHIDQLTQTGPVEIQIDAGSPDDGKSILLDEQRPAGSGFMNGLTADVIVDVPKNAWLKGQDLNVEIAGKINLKKAPAKPFTLLGSLNTVRGTYTFQGKLFKMTRGGVDFIGLEEPNPNIDIEAETRIKKVNIKLKLSGTARNMILSLDSDPPLEQSDIIAYLVFGRPVSDLNNQQSFSAEQAALNITGQMAVKELKSLLGDAFLIDTLTLDSGGEDIQQGAISAGKYISPDVFVLYRHRFKADEPDQIEVTYELNRNFSIETQLGDEKSSGIDFVWEFDF